MKFYIAARIAFHFAQAAARAAHRGNRNSVSAWLVPDDAGGITLER